MLDDVYIIKQILFLFLQFAAAKLIPGQEEVNVCDL